MHQSLWNNTHGSVFSRMRNEQELRCIVQGKDISCNWNLLCLTYAYSYDIVVLYSRRSKLMKMTSETTNRTIAPADANDEFAQNAYLTQTKNCQHFNPIFIISLWDMILSSQGCLSKVRNSKNHVVSSLPKSSLEDNVLT